MNNLPALSARLKQYSAILQYDSRLYRILSRSAPDEKSMNKAQELASQCGNTADALYDIYRSMTRDNSLLQPPSVHETGSFRSVLRSRLSHELSLEADFRREYLSISDNLKLKRLFFNASHSAMSRAVGILDLLL